jgi:hypothetical protein
MARYTQSVRGDSDAMVRRYEYDDEDVLVADFGHVARASGHAGSVDLVDGTAIVVVDDEQYEFDVPANASRGIINNGIVTVEMGR